jgi:hypothetical protein
MDIKIILAEEEGFDFVRVRGLAVDTKIIAEGKEFQISFISKWSLNFEIDALIRINVPFTLDVYRNYVVVTEVSSDSISETIRHLTSNDAIDRYRIS